MGETIVSQNKCQRLENARTHVWKLDASLGFCKQYTKSHAHFSEPSTVVSVCALIPFYVAQESRTCVECTVSHSASSSTVIAMFHHPLLGVPLSSSPCSIPSSFQTTPTALTGIHTDPCAAPREGLLFGSLTSPKPFTGYEPNSWIEVSSECAPVHYLRKTQASSRKVNIRSRSYLLKT